MTEQVTITRSQLEGWEREAAEHELKATVLRAKIDAVRELFQQKQSVIPESEFYSMSKTKKLLSVMQEQPDRFFTPGKLKDALTNMGETEEVWNKDFTYIYQTIARLKKQEKVIHKGGKGYRFNSNFQD